MWSSILIIPSLIFLYVSDFPKVIYNAFIISKTVKHFVVITALKTVSNTISSYRKVKEFKKYLFTSRITRINKQYSTLNFNIATEPYTIFINNRTKPSNIFMIYYLDEENNEIDITDNIKRYLGPNDDWFNSKLTPEMLGYNIIIIATINGDEHIIEKTDILPIF